MGLALFVTAVKLNKKYVQDLQKLDRIQVPCVGSDHGDSAQLRSTQAKQEVFHLLGNDSIITMITIVVVVVEVQ